MAITLMAVAAIARRMINLEKERWLLNATRLAMKREMFKRRKFYPSKIDFTGLSEKFFRN
jgi:hypothetical protein